jgi:hypothetical protein
MMTDDDDLLDRAIRTYGANAQGKATSISNNGRRALGLEEHTGRRYVCLRNVYGLLEAHRITPSGRLRGLDHGPFCARCNGTGRVQVKKVLFAIERGCWW